MAIQSSNNPQQPLSEINVTPFVDVMLVLLIIFMVTAPMIQQGIEVDLPKTSRQGAMTMEEKDIVITIDASKSITIGKAKIEPGQMQESFEAIFENKPVKVAYLQSDQKVSYGFVVSVMNALKNAGVENVGLVTQDD